MSATARSNAACTFACLDGQLKRMIRRANLRHLSGTDRPRARGTPLVAAAAIAGQAVIRSASAAAAKVGRALVTGLDLGAFAPVGFEYQGRDEHCAKQYAGGHIGHRNPGRHGSSIKWTRANKVRRRS